MIITIKDYEKIRKMYAVEKLSVREISRVTGYSRNTVAKYCKGDTMPGNRKEYLRESIVVNEDITLFIQQCLDEDEIEGHKKQKHTAKRIHERLVGELDFLGGESTIRRHVREMRASTPTAYIPLLFDPAEAIQIDFGEAYGYYQGNKIKFYFFCARLCYSAMPFVFAAPKKNRETFLEGLKRAFEFFGGVPLRVIFDNDKVAVKNGFSRTAENQPYLEAMIAHYAFTMEYCNRSSGNEKGLVENLVGWSRRNFFVPLPKFETFNELNGMILKRCMSYGETHQIKGKLRSVKSYLAEESALLMPLPKYSFNTAKTSDVRVNSMGLVKVSGCEYSVPYALIGQLVTVKQYATAIEIIYKRETVCRYEITLDSNKTKFQLAHYLDILERKPRSILNARPVKETLSLELQTFAKKISSTPQELIRFLHLCCEHDLKELESAIYRLQPCSLEQLEIDFKPKSNAKTLEKLKSLDQVIVEKTPLCIYDQLISGGDTYPRS